MIWLIRMTPLLIVLLSMISAAVYALTDRWWSAAYWLTAAVLNLIVIFGMNR